MGLAGCAQTCLIRHAFASCCGSWCSSLLTSHGVVGLLLWRPGYDGKAKMYMGSQGNSRESWILLEVLKLVYQVCLCLLPTAAAASAP